MVKQFEYAKYYHIYNCGINRCNLFIEDDNYRHFLGLYEKYIEPITETYAWCLMKNHFHLLIKIFDEKEIIQFSNLTGLQNLSGLKYKNNQSIIAHQFSNFFNAYAKAFNKRYNRTGSLFERPVKRIEVDNIHYFKELVLYIHHNPQKHCFTENYKDYPWSSYGSVVSLKPTKLKRDKVIGWFNDVGNFITVHSGYRENVDLSYLFLE
ncbi:MAG: transposase [Bacteroidetes bacterium]|nr:transposase [Bacteroidota bacterium]